MSAAQRKGLMYTFFGELRPKELLKEAFFSAVEFPFWTKKVRERCNHPIDMRVGAFESL